MFLCKNVNKKLREKNTNILKKIVYKFKFELNRIFAMIKLDINDSFLASRSPIIFRGKGFTSLIHMCIRLNGIIFWQNHFVSFLEKGKFI